MDKIDILVVGGGGREHAIIKQLKKSPRAGKIYCAPGNGGICADAECFPEVKATDIDGVTALAKKLGVDLVFVAPDDPLVMGMTDKLRSNGITAFGPSAAAAIIEGSKAFSKELMRRYNIPTAGYKVFDEPDAAIEYIRESDSYPVVIKADGLALGKGVIIAADFDEARAAVVSMMEQKVFGSSGDKIVVEEFLTGPEVTVLAFTDGKTVKPMVSSMDHKRALDGNKGLNTGGMGTISPNPFYTDDIAKVCMDTIFRPTVDAMSKEGRPFKGCLYFGLMLTPKGPKVIEYNCRFGDPEAQVILPRLKTDLIDIIYAIIEERLDSIDIQWNDKACACVVLASGGYPQKYEKGKLITGLDSDGGAKGAVVFHAGTKLEDGKYYTNGGRVLGVTAQGVDLEQALDSAYRAVEGISFEGCHYRRDIGRAYKK